MSNTPQDFDFDAWLDGADRPQRSVTVYQKAGLIADLDALAVRIEHAEPDDEVDGPSMGGGVAQLRAEYAQLAQQFHDSALTIRLKGHDDDEKREFAQAHRGDAQSLGNLVLADAFLEPKITPAQVGKLEKTIGQAQFKLITAAYLSACNEVPVVSADFLPKSSTVEDGGEY
jgi:hypothetical protein